MIASFVPPSAGMVVLAKYIIQDGCNCAIPFNLSAKRNHTGELEITFERLSVGSEKGIKQYPSFENIQIKLFFQE